MAKKLYLFKFNALQYTAMVENPTARVFANDFIATAILDAWRNQSIVEGGGADDLQVRPNAPVTMCPWALLAIKQPFFIPLYLSEQQAGYITGARDLLSREIAKISKACFSSKIKRAQVEFEKVQATAQGIGASVSTDTTNKAETRKMTDDLRAVGGMAQPARDIVTEERTGGGVTATQTGTMQATPEELFENAGIGAGIRSPYEKAAEKIAGLVIPEDYEENARYYESAGADWWRFAFGEDLENAIIWGGA